MSVEARYDDVEEVNAAHRILRTPRNEPLGHATLEELCNAEREKVSPAPRRLDPDLRWFLPGPLYCVMGLDRSIFHLFAWARKRDVPVVTHLAAKPVVEIFRAESIHPWLATVQGVHPDIAGPLVDYVESYRFEDRARGLTWCASAVELRVADPFAQERVGVSLIAFLPECLTSGRRLVPESLTNLTLERPRLVVRKVGSQDGTQ